MKTTLPPTFSTSLAYEHLPRDYAGLCSLLLPRPIRSRRQATSVESLIDTLAVHERRLSADQRDYLQILSSLIEAWDQNQELDVAKNPTPGEFLRLLLETSGQSGAMVARALGLDRSAMTRLLKGERSFTVSQARALAAYFAVDAGVFLGLSRS
jgi:antitoxin component HigA of HigAB toxin-antitoxin module